MVAAPLQEEFIHCLFSMLQRFQDVGLKVKREKCKLGVPHISFVGFTVNTDGIHPVRLR